VARTEFKRAYEEAESETPALPASEEEPPQS
jgi:hypothetical protein